MSISENAATLHPSCHVFSAHVWLLILACMIHIRSSEKMGKLFNSPGNS